VYLYVFGLAAMKITRITCCFDTFFLEKSARPPFCESPFVRLSPDRFGPLGDPQLTWHSYHQEPVTVHAVTLHSSNSNASMNQYECTVVVHNLYCDRNSAQKETSGQNLKVLNRLIIIMIYTKHNH
jgi:hypothetical protein